MQGELYTRVNGDPFVVSANACERIEPFEREIYENNKKHH